MSLGSPIFFAAACGLLAVTLLAAIVRRIGMPRRARVCIVLGAMMLCLAAGGLTMSLPGTGQVVVMVDLSPSTRIAAYRDSQLLDSRISQLLGSTKYRVEKFADSTSIDRTIFEPPKADAIVLFSDGQFELPKSAPPIYIVVDPNLEHPDDASVIRLESRGQSIDAMIHNPGPPREIQFIGVREGATTAPSGDPAISAQVGSDPATVTVRLVGSDPWPENDALSIHPVPRGPSQRWWIGANPASDYRAIQPQDLPTDPAVYLSASLIVLNDISVDALTAAQQQRLMQYVRDLGGGLIIIGGEHAFAAGGYPGTTLDTLSPLASAPTQSQRNWIILVDASGSMATVAGGQTRWQRASVAAVQLLRRLPQSDIVSIGSFARDLRWWAQDRSAGYTSQRPLPPTDITPQGPTNLQAALQSVLSSLNGTTITEIILITDADAAIDDPPALANALRNARARINLLATGDALNSPVMRLTALTAGNIMAQPDPSLWTDASQKLLRSALPDRVERSAIEITFTGSFSSLQARVLKLWNRTWTKPQAIELANTGQGSARIPLGATWQVGLGQVGAFGFGALPSELRAMADLVAHEPRDPRFSVSIKSEKSVSVRVDALDNGTFMNDLDMQLVLIDESDSSSPTTMNLTQSAPGRYESSFSPLRSGALALVRVASKVVDRFALAGRYAPEFDSIGNDHQAMNELAQRTNGAVIDPSQTTPIDFHWPARSASLVSMLAILGAVMLATGLLLWKRGI